MSCVSSGRGQLGGGAEGESEIVQTLVEKYFNEGHSLQEALVTCPHERYHFKS
jgi:hypothetical protein